MAFKSHPIEEERRTALTPEDLLAAIRRGQIRRIVWLHSEVGGAVSFPLFGRRTVSYQVEQRDIPLVHEFGPLLGLIRTRPLVMGKALAGALS